MRVITNDEVRILVPNQEHKNFTDSGKRISGGKILEGEPRIVNGLRRGEPFEYRVFITNDNEIVYQDKLEPMKATEVTLGADAQQTPTKVNIRPEEKFNGMKIGGLVLGGLAAYMYARKKKMGGTKTAMWVFGGAALGYGAAYMIDKKRGINYTESK